MVKTRILLIIICLFSFIGNWKSVDHNEALIGIIDFSYALSQHTGTSPYSAFKCVMGDPPFQAKIVKDEFSGYATGHGLYFRPGKVTKRLVVHELAHWFAFRINAINEEKGPEYLLENYGVWSGDQLITGTTQGIFYLRNNHMNAPENGYYSDDYRDEYQIHPRKHIMGVNESEDFADMVLNWVYKSFVPNRAGKALYAWVDSHMQIWLLPCTYRPGDNMR